MKKKIRKVLFIEFIFLLLVFMSLYLYNSYDSEKGFKVFCEKIKQEHYDSPNEDHLLSKDNIAIQNEELYVEIEKGLLEGKSIINLIGLSGYKSSETVFETVKEVTYNNPEIMYYEGGKYLSGILKPNYSKDKEEILLQQNVIRKLKKDILNRIIEPNMTEYEKVKAVHDYIINNTKYDKRLFENNEVPLESHTVYGTLAKGTAVCEGYAKTVKYLLDELGIENMVVVGTSKGINHAWNIVKIDGEYYHLDSTWDDPLTPDNSDIILYDYFNLTDDEISVTHSWEKDNYPKCSSHKYNYYYYNGLVVNSYDEFYDKLRKVILKKERGIELKIKNFKAEQYNIENIVEKIVKNNRVNIKAINYTYSINSELGIIKIFFEYH